ncbi:MAG TPA: hypothetical protein VJN66_07625 [Rhodanobacteraceae bacterium]|nr:hypothetical protein [Rhodanobacteraceae bacterium]
MFVLAQEQREISAQRPLVNLDGVIDFIQQQAQCRVAKVTPVPQWPDAGGKSVLRPDNAIPDGRLGRTAPCIQHAALPVENLGCDESLARERLPGAQAPVRITSSKKNRERVQHRDDPVETRPEIAGNGSGQASKIERADH